jgi:hypothetical protein
VSLVLQTAVKRGHQLIIFCGLIWTDLIMAENAISGPYADGHHV